MTDLEDAWNRYPTSTPPTADMAASAQRSRRLVVPAAGGVIAAGVAIGLVVTLNSGGGTPVSASAGAAQANHPTMTLAAFKADLKPAASCSQLLASYRTRGEQQVGPYGWNTMVTYGGVAQLSSDLALGTKGGYVRAPLADQATRSTSSATGTNVQEADVDEPDSVKTNGSLLVRIDGGTIAVYTLGGSEPQRVATMAFPYFDSGQILLSGTTLIAIGANSDPAATSSSSRVVTVALNDPSHPRITSNVTYAGYVSSARQHGTSIRLVLASDLPTLPFVQPTPNRSENQALRENRRIVAKSTLSQWLSTVNLGDGSRQLMDCTQVAITPASVPVGTTSVIGFDSGDPTAVSAIGLSGQTSAAYESSDHLYLTSSGAQMGPCACPRMPYLGAATQSDKTVIFQFDLVGDQASHVATGTVRGTIRDRQSMDEVGGVLRVATTESGSNGQSSSVVTLKPSGTKLVQVGRLDGLGRDEDLTAARWFDTFAVVSTAAQVDPLYTIDLKNPSRPRLLGSLHIPGYSSYFHPLGNGLLLGVGQNVSFASGGEQNQAQVGLFDISDLSHVRRLAVTSLALGTYSPVGENGDAYGFTWLPDRQMALTAFGTDNSTVVLGEFEVKGNKLSKKLVTVPGTDPGSIRTIELPNGRVVLMAGGTVRFLSLPS